MFGIFVKGGYPGFAKDTVCINFNEQAHIYATRSGAVEALQSKTLQRMWAIDDSGTLAVFELPSPSLIIKRV